MNPDLEKKIISDCPNLYAGQLDFGFECLDGWFSIIHDLSLELEKILDGISPNSRGNFIAVQVKEKFGRLSFYLVRPDFEMDNCIKRARIRASVTCEYCGAPGRLREGAWLRTLCDDCESKKPWRNK